MDLGHWDPAHKRAQRGRIVASPWLQVGLLRVGVGVRFWQGIAVPVPALSTVRGAAEISLTSINETIDVPLQQMREDAVTP
jgi:hypothetical protein